MRLFVLVFLGVACCVEAGHDVDVIIEECESEQCACKPAISATVFNLKYQDDLNCYCPCGAERSEPCHADADCILGLHCAAGEMSGGHGKCEDACKKPGFSCGIFDKCHVNGQGEPDCLCRMWECSNMTIGYGVCAWDHMEDKKLVYNNDCLYLNANCERRKSNNLGIERVPLQDCAELINFPAAYGVYGSD